MEGKKYPRTYHLPFSPGSTNDDKKLKEGWFKNYIGQEIVITEKLDGSNTGMTRFEVYSRSAATGTRNSWDINLWDKDGLFWKIKDFISENEEIYGENLYGEHSIHYNKLTDYFHLFAVNDGVNWYSWDDVKMMADIMNIPHVPELYRGIFYKEQDCVDKVLELVKQPSVYGDQREGIVMRLTSSFKIEDFPKYVCKWVRPNHVQTDEHWTKNWKKAELLNK